MKKTKYTEEQIAFALRQEEAGTPMADICRKMGISEATFYRWKQKFGGMGVAELRRLRQLEEENHKGCDRRMMWAGERAVKHLPEEMPSSQRKSCDLP
jgi:putative transposase